MIIYRAFLFTLLFYANLFPQSAAQVSKALYEFKSFYVENRPEFNRLVAKSNISEYYLLEKYQTAQSYFNSGSNEKAYNELCEISKVLDTILLSIADCQKVATEKTLSLKVAGIFGDNMVLQREAEVPIWGWAAPTTVVSVSIGTQKVNAVAANDSLWTVRLSPMKPGGSYTLTISTNVQSHSFNNVCFGDVWLCGGQSNMQFSVKNSLHAPREIASANFPNIRLVYIDYNASVLPVNNCFAIWKSTTPQSVKNFTAIGYYFAKELHSTMNIPVGIIQSCWGGTKIDAWMSLRALGSSDEFSEAPKIYNRSSTNFTRLYGKSERHTPTVLYNGMIHPLRKAKLKGVLWFQGESGSIINASYEKLLRALIYDWRTQFDDSRLPFGIVQLTNVGKKGTVPFDNSTLPQIRESQYLACKNVKNCGLAVTLDLNDTPHDVHFKNKREAAHRLFKWASAKVYGKNITYSGPEFHSVRVSKDTALIHFLHAQNGLTLKKNVSSGFAIAGADGIYQCAEAIISRDIVKVWSPLVKNPKIVSYGWANNPPSNLYNNDSLPAIPFKVTIN